jgi:hypothetical protein
VVLLERRAQLGGRAPSSWRNFEERPRCTSSCRTVARPPGVNLSRIETDKVEMDIDAPATGKVTYLVEIGRDSEVGTLIATIAES